VRGGKSASLRTADTPKICGNIGLVLVDGHVICTFAVSASNETKAVSVRNMAWAAEAAAPVPRANVCIRRDQQAADFKVGPAIAEQCSGVSSLRTKAKSQQNCKIK
jgi:hypothetical protein